MVNKRDKHW